MKKLFSVLLAVLVLFTPLAEQIPAPAVTTVSAAAAKTISLNKTELKIRTKNTYQLKLRNAKKKIKWSSSAPEIASVDKNGLVTAHKKGTAVITAVSAGKTYECAVTVKYVLPKAVKAGYTITKKETIIQTSRFKMTVPAGVYVPDHIKESIHDMMDTVEEVTGLSFTSDYYRKYYADYPKQVYINVWKLEGDAEYGSAIGDIFGAHFASGDLLIDAGGPQVLLHELTHCIHRRNGYWMSSTMAEALTTYCERVYADKINKPYYFDAAYNYSLYEDEITAQNAEELFIQTDVDYYSSYDYGYRLMHYFVETYGMEEFFNLAKSKAVKYKDPMNEFITNEEMAKVLKKRYGKDFFTKFGTWYTENQEMFVKEERIYDLSDFSKVDLYPFYGAYCLYDIDNFTYEDYVILDLSNGFEYITKYKKDKLTGSVTATLSAKGETKAAFYSADGQKLKTVKLGETPITVTVKNAALIRFAGDGEQVRINLDFDKIVR